MVGPDESDGVWNPHPCQLNLLACYGLDAEDAVAMIARQRELEAAKLARRATSARNVSYEGGSGSDLSQFSPRQSPS